MRRDPRKQPWQTFPFWFLILSGLAMTVAWKLDLLRPRTPEAVTQEAPASEESAPDWAAEGEATAEVANDSAEVTNEGPAEPVVEGEAPRSFPDGEATEEVSAPDQDEPESAAATVSNATPKESASEANPFSRPDARLTAAHKQQPPEEGQKPSSLAAIVTETSRSKSPFGPTKIVLKGNGKRNSATPPANNADSASTKATPDHADAKEGTIVQTAAVDSDISSQSDGFAGDQPQSTLRLSNSAKARMAAANEPVDFAAIDQLIADGEDVEANFQLSNLYWKQPEIRKQLAERLRAVSYRIYFAPQPHYMDGHVVEAGDTLQNIAKQSDVSWEYLAKLNRTDPKKIRPGQNLKLIRGPFAAVIDLSDMDLTIHSHGHFVHAFPIGLGKDSSAPLGTFKVQEKQRDPTYYGPEGVIEHDDAKNPLGEYLLDLGNNYSIHGTIDESSIGKAESQGCIRLKNRDIADVYDLLTTDSEVLIRR